MILFSRASILLATASSEEELRRKNGNFSGNVGTFCVGTE